MKTMRLARHCAVCKEIYFDTERCPVHKSVLHHVLLTGEEGAEEPQLYSLDRLDISTLRAILQEIADSQREDKGHIIRLDNRITELKKTTDAFAVTVMRKLTELVADIDRNRELYSGIDTRITELKNTLEMKY